MLVNDAMKSTTSPFKKLKIIFLMHIIQGKHYIQEAYYKLHFTILGSSLWH